MESLPDIAATEGILHTELQGLVLVLEWLAALIALLAIAVMLIGTVRFLVGFIRAETLKTEANRARIINRERVELGRYILSGLELFIVSDIIHTALSLALGDLLFLGLLVAIRSAISYFLDMEISEIKEDPER
ncbi:MAG: putative membrane protein [Rhodobacteraceae bacterium HLUCCO18]|nr:MAG: putative membrane protein [Rhodobacteraceae bacterium HLUCCO18]